MQRVFTMPIIVTAGRFNDGGELIPTRISCDGIEHSVLASSCGLRLAFQHNGHYFWLERQARGWGISRRIR